MARKRKHINSRADFFRVLDEAIDMTHERLGRGLWSPLQSIGAQLEAIKKWTDGGREPTVDERKLVDIGLVVARELEPAADVEEQRYNERLYEIQGYFGEWLSDAQLAAPDDDPLKHFPLG
jgi:hypothetical protein